jgi:hypothetical protein
MAGTANRNHTTASGESKEHPAFLPGISHSSTIIRVDLPEMEPITGLESPLAKGSTRKPSLDCKFVDRPTPDGFQPMSNFEFLRGFSLN